MTAQAKNTSESMTGLLGVLSAIIKPSSIARKQAEELGIQFDMAAVQAKGLAQFLKDVASATNGDAEALSALFGRVEALSVVMALTSQEGGALFERNLRGIGEAAGTTELQFATAAQAMNFKMAQIRQGFARLAREVGLTILQEIAPSAGSIPEALEKAIPRIKVAIRDMIHWIKHNLEYLITLFKTYLLSQGLGIIGQFATQAALSLNRAVPPAAPVPPGGGPAPPPGPAPPAPSGLLAAVTRVAIVAIGAKVAWELGVVIGDVIGRATMRGDLVTRESELEQLRARTTLQTVLGLGDVSGASKALQGSGALGKLTPAQMAKLIFGDKATRERMGQLAMSEAMGGISVNMEALGRLMEVRGKSDPAFREKWNAVSGGKLWENFGESAVRRFFTDRMAESFFEAIEKTSHANPGERRMPMEKAMLSVRQALLDNFRDSEKTQRELLSFLLKEAERREAVYAETIAALKETASSTATAIRDALAESQFAQGFANTIGAGVADALAAGKGIGVSIFHQIFDRNKNRGHAVRRAARGDGTARHLNAKYRMHILRSGEAAGVIEPLQENFFTGHMLNHEG